MIYEPSALAMGVFAFFVAIVLGISFYLGSKAKSAKGYYAAHGEIPWLVNGVAFAGDYLSAASFLGICGMIAFYGYDGFLYSIGYLAGWVVALLVIAEPLKRLGKYTFADALDSRFQSKGIRVTAAISTLVVSIFYLIPQMVGAGALIKPLLGLSSLFGLNPDYESPVGVVLVGVVVIVIVVTAGMVSTTWVQFLKGALLVVFCTVLTGMILVRGLSTAPPHQQHESSRFRPFHRELAQAYYDAHPELEVLPETGPWQDTPYVRLRNTQTGELSIWCKRDNYMFSPFENKVHKAALIDRAQYVMVAADGKTIVINGLEKGSKGGDFHTVGQVYQLNMAGPGGATKVKDTGPLDPLSYLATIQNSTLVLWEKDPEIEDADGSKTTVYQPRLTKGRDVLLPGGSPTFAGLRQGEVMKKLDFISLMLALFAGTASLPHILIRYYTVKDQASARKSTMVGIASIGFFYVLTLFLGLGAMTSGALDPTNSNMSAPLLARTFGELPFAVISAIAFTTVLGTVSGLILAASGAVAHDLLTTFLKWEMTDYEKVRAGKLAAVVVGVIAIALGIVFEKFNVNYLVGWAFNIAASANLPALVMLLFWKGTTKQGITASIVVGLFGSLAWILASGEAYMNVYGLKPEAALVPFSQPALVTLPLSFAVLVLVSLMTRARK
ncbi:MAG TPA: cation acetate symporter [Pirellulaceae bacterium]|nr:cation acetate symporter [Pirellulaceae bacterium]